MRLPATAGCMRSRVGEVSHLKLWNEEVKDTPSNNRTTSREQQACGTAFVYKPNQYQSRERDQDKQDRRNVNYQTPNLASVAAFVQVIYDRNEAIAGFGDVILACIAVNEGVGGVARGTEGDGDLVVFDAKVGDGAVNVFTVAEHFGEAELIRTVSILRPQHNLVSYAEVLSGTRMREPVRMVQRESCGGKE